MKSGKGIGLIAGGSAVLLLLIANHIWLTPIVRHFQDLCEGRLPDVRVTELVSRAARYPYHAFLVSLVGVLTIAAAARTGCRIPAIARPIPTTL